MFQGVPRIIATAVVHGARRRRAHRSRALEHAADASRGARARRHRASRTCTTILLTHIHLDHAGATGTLVARTRGCASTCTRAARRTWSIPTKLLASATRLYGDDDGSAVGRGRAGAGGVDDDPRKAASASTSAAATLDVAYTPGHASHHVSYFNARFRRRVCRRHGRRPADAGRVHPAADAAARHRSRGLAREPGAHRAWRPGHAVSSRTSDRRRRSRAHLTELRDHTGARRRARRRRRSRARGPTSDREAWFADEMRRELRRRMNEADAAAYEIAGRFDLSWRGLARYWQKRAKLQRELIAAVVRPVTPSLAPVSRRADGALRVDHQPQRQSLRAAEPLSAARRGRPPTAHGPAAARSGSAVASRDVAFELELHEPKQRDRHRPTGTRRRRRTR